MTTVLPSPSDSGRRIAAPLLLACLCVLGMGAMWIILSLVLNRHCAWMAVAAAADIALMLRVGGAAPGAWRATVTVLATFATIVLANWGIASTHIGGSMGFGMIDSASRLGPHLAWTLAGLANHAVEWCWYGIAFVVAIWLGR